MLKKAFMYLLERTTQAKVLKLGLYVPWMGFYKSDIGIRKILILPKLQTKITQKSNMAAILRHFLSVKLAKMKIFQNPMYFLKKPTQGT